MLLSISDNDRSILDGLLTCVAKGEGAAGTAGEALSSIYKLIGGRLFLFALGYVKNKQLAEDVLHDGFISIAQNAREYKNGTNAYAFLCRIIRNTALNKIKSEKIRQTEDIDNFYDLCEDNDIYENSAVSLAVRAALLKLDKKERICIYLKYYSNFTLREIEKRTSLKKSSIAEIIKRAEIKLKSYLKET